MASFWPEPVEYAEAVQMPRTSFGDAELQAASAETGMLGPVMYSGNFASVFHLVSADVQRGWAIKCFTRRVSGQHERYLRISEHLAAANLQCAVDFQYQPEGVRIRGEWFPILKMNWVDGLTLSEFVDQNVEDRRYIGRLYRIWLRLEPHLRSTQTVHGDLQHGNILLVPGQSQGKLSLRVIDYDGLWTPALADTPSGEAGHSAYQHPERQRRGLYTPEMDRFPHLVIAAALRCLSRPNQADLWGRYQNGENLLFRKTDFENPGSSELLYELWTAGDSELQAWAGLIAMSAAASFEATPRLAERLVDGRLPPLAPNELARANEILGPPTSRRNVRDSWSAAMDYLKAGAANPGSDSFRRAEQLALTASPEPEQTKLWQEAIRRNVAAEHCRSALIEFVGSTARSLCPGCWEFIDSDQPAPRSVQIDQHGNIDSNVVSIRKVELLGVWHGVEISPWQLPAPPLVLSRLGAIAAIAILFWLPCAVLGIMGLQGHAGTQTYALGAFLGGLAGVLIVAETYRPRSTEPVDVAWVTVVPELLRDPEIPRPERTSFLSSLANASRSFGDGILREHMLHQTIQFVGQLVRQGTVPVPQLSELLRLRWEDSSRDWNKHGRREKFLTETLWKVVYGEIPLRCLDFATEDGRTVSRCWHEESIAVAWSLVLAAKSAGLVAADLSSLVSSSSALAAVVKAAKIQASVLANFRAILDLEGSSELPKGLLTARQLISRGDYTLFLEDPTLLARSNSPIMDANAIRLTVDGIVFRNTWFDSPPKVTVVSHTQFDPPVGYYQTRGYVLTVGNLSQTYSADPTALAESIRGLSEFLFHRLIPAATELSLVPTTAKLPLLIAGPPTTCPHCQSRLLFRLGTIADRLSGSEPMPSHGQPGAT